MAFIDEIKEESKSRQEDNCLPESMIRRTFEAC